MRFVWSCRGISGSFFIDIFGAVAINEISFCRLKAGMKAFGHLSSKRRYNTARVILEAVAVNEMTF